MARKRETPPPHFEIAEKQWTWLSKLATFEFCDIEDAKWACWACGFSKIGSGLDKPTTERAHIVPHSAQGSNDSSNYLLLCGACHREQPDGATFEEQKEWLEDHPSWANPDIMKSRYPAFSRWFFPWLSNLPPRQAEKVANSFSTEKLSECFDKAEEMSGATRTETIRANRGILMKRYFLELLEQGEINA